MSPEPGELVMVAPRRAKPPRHLADLDLAGRREWLVELGHSAFRADQLSRHNSLEFSQGGLKMTAKVPNEVEMEIEVEITAEGGELEIEISW